MRYGQHPHFTTKATEDHREAERRLRADVSAWLRRPAQRAFVCVGEALYRERKERPARRTWR